MSPCMLHSLSAPDDGLHLIINLCLLNYNLLFTHRTVLYTLIPLSLDPFVECTECRVVPTALFPPPTNATDVSEGLCLAQAGSCLRDRKTHSISSPPRTYFPPPVFQWTSFVTISFRKNPSSLGASSKVRLLDSSGAPTVTWYLQKILSGPLPAFHEHELCFEECP